MRAGTKILAVFMTLVVTPAFSVESMYLDSVPITYEGEFLAPAGFYSQVPPPTSLFNTIGSLVPATIYDYGLTPTHNSVTPAAYSTLPVASETAPDSSETKLRVLIKAGLDNASDVPVAVFQDHFSNVDSFELVDDGDVYDVLVEVQTMKLAPSGTVFIVVNASREVDDESLIFYNTFGYMGELKLLSGSAGYATQLESALESEAERLSK